MKSKEYETIKLNDGRTIQLKFDKNSCTSCVIGMGRWGCNKQNYPELKNKPCLNGYYSVVKNEVLDGEKN